MGNASLFPTVMKWILRVGIVAYFVLTYLDKKPDFVAFEALVLCAAFSAFMPIAINRNLFVNVVLAVFAGFYVFAVKELGFNFLKYQLNLPQNDSYVKEV